MAYCVGSFPLYKLHINHKHTPYGNHNRLTLRDGVLMLEVSLGRAPAKQQHSIKAKRVSTDTSNPTYVNAATRHTIGDRGRRGQRPGWCIMLDNDSRRPPDTKCPLPLAAIVGTSGHGGVCLSATRGCYWGIA